MIQVLLVDLLERLFKSSKLTIQFFENVRRHDFWQNSATSADLGLPVDFLELLFKSSKFVIQFSEDERRHLFAELISESPTSSKRRIFTRAPQACCRAARPTLKHQCTAGVQRM